MIQPEDFYSADFFKLYNKLEKEVQDRRQELDELKKRVLGPLEWSQHPYRYEIETNIAWSQHQAKGMLL